MGRRRKETRFYVMTVSVCVIAMIIVVAAALLLYDRLRAQSSDNNRKEEDVMADAPLLYSQKEADNMVADAVSKAVADTTEKVKAQTQEALLNLISQGLSSGQTILGTLRPLYPDNLVVASGGRYHFVPINRNLLMHERLQENLQILESGEFQYVEDGQVVSHKGIDISLFQGKIDWEKVAADGVEYVFIRVGYRGYGKEGRLVVDEMFAQNIQGAKAAGLKVGVYFFGQAVTVEEAKEEAGLVLEQLSPYQIDYPVVYDVERVNSDSARTNNLDAATRTDIVIAFLEEIKGAGYQPMVYANLEMYAVLLEFERLESYDKWFAYYGEEMYFPYHYDMWQYTEKGTVDGINGAVDMNISFKEW